MLTNVAVYKYLRHFEDLQAYSAVFARKLHEAVCCARYTLSAALNITSVTGSSSKMQGVRQLITLQLQQHPHLAGSKSKRKTAANDSNDTSTLKPQSKGTRFSNSGAAEISTSSLTHRVPPPPPVCVFAMANLNIDSLLKAPPAPVGIASARDAMNFPASHNTIAPEVLSRAGLTAHEQPVTPVSALSPSLQVIVLSITPLMLSIGFI